jgi:hypothetical protein
MSEIFKLSIYQNRYYIIEIDDKEEFTIIDLKKIVQIQSEMGEKKLPVLVLCSQYSTGDVEMLRYLSKNQNNPYSLADAFVIKTMAQKIIGNFYIKLISKESQRPSKLFNNKEDAVNWLNQF